MLLNTQNSTNYNIGIIGATGLTGTTLLKILEERSFPINNLYLIASKNSTGRTLSFKNKSYMIHALEEFDFAKLNIAFFCVSSELSAIYAEKAAAANCIVIDKSNYYRNHPDVPLVIPEVNLSALENYKRKNIIASPNCNTVPIAVGLKPIYDAVGIQRINVATYQSVSGTGKDALDELTQQSKQLLNQQAIHAHVYPKQIAFNLLPHIDQFEENGYTREEMKIVLELRKIFDDHSLAINPTAVRVPVYYGHSAAVHIETKHKLNASDAMQLLKQAPGVRVISGDLPYPTPATDAAHHDAVFIGRIRDDISHQNGLNFWIVTDNLRKGASLNAIQMAESLIKHYL